MRLPAYFARTNFFGVTRRLTPQGIAEKVQDAPAY
jgi:hypothetical protein